MYVHVCIYLIWVFTAHPFSFARWRYSIPRTISGTVTTAIFVRKWLLSAPQQKKNSMTLHFFGAGDATGRPSVWDVGTHSSEFLRTECGRWSRLNALPIQNHQEPGMFVNYLLVHYPFLTSQRDSFMSRCPIQTDGVDELIRQASTTARQHKHVQCVETRCMYVIWKDSKSNACICHTVDLPYFGEPFGSDSTSPTSRLGMASFKSPPPPQWSTLLEKFQNKAVYRE